MNINSILTSFWSSIKAYLGNNYLGKTAKAESAKSADSIAWANVSDKPSTYTPSSHTHDDRYYTETEIDTKLNSKVNISDLSTVATSGSYNDLNDKPTIPTKISDLTNDSGFVIDVSGKADKSTTLSGYGITDAYTKTQVDKKVSDLVNSAPETLDTLNELASALGNDPNFATTIATQIGSKANDSDVVHKSGNETIGGVKTFTSSTVVDGSGKFYQAYASDYIKGDIPSTTYYQGLRFYDDQKISTVDNHITGAFEMQYNTDGYNKAYIGCRNCSGTTQLNYNVGLRVPNDSTKSIDFSPSVNNKINLGTPDYKWADTNTVLLNGKTPAYADDLTNYVTRTEVNTLQTNRLKPSSVVFTVAPSDWQNGVCTKNVGVDSKYHCTLGVPVSTNTTNLVNVSSASIIITDHSGDNLTLKCLGNVPTSEITLELTVFYYDVIDKNTDYFNITEQEINDIFGL